MRVILRLLAVALAAFLVGSLMVPRQRTEDQGFGKGQFMPLAGDSSPSMLRVMRTGWMTGRVRDTVLFKTWSETPGQLERAGCVTEWRVKTYTRTLVIQKDSVLALDSMFYVDKVVPKAGVAATPTRFTFNQKDMCGKGVPVWHIHPPHTCKDRDNPSTCRSGGNEAYQCQPSEDDYLLLIESRASFSIVQCGEKHFRFYYPYEYLSQFSSIANSPKVLKDTLKQLKTSSSNKAGVR